MIVYKNLFDRYKREKKTRQRNRSKIKRQPDKSQRNRKMVATELIVGMEEMVNYIRDLEEENKKLKQYQPKGSQIDPEGLHDYMKEEIDKLKEQNKKLQEYKDLEKDILVSDVNEKQDKISLLEAENKKLKEDLDDKEHWNQTMVSYMDDGDGWCHFDEWLGENIDEDDKKQEWVKEWMENTEYEDPDSP